MKLSIHDEESQRRCAAAIMALDVSKQFWCYFERKKDRRTISQNSLYWDWLSSIGRHFGYEKEEIHEVLMRKFLTPGIVDIDGEEYEVYSTKKLPKNVMSEYMDSISRFAESEGIVLKRPEDMQMIGSYLSLQTKGEGI